MPPFRLSYPVTPEVKAALVRFPGIRKTVPIPDSGLSELHIVRLLGNTHYPHLDRLLAFIERELPGSGDIGPKALKQLDPFPFRELLAELFLFAHLRARLGPGVRPVDGPQAGRIPEIECAWQALTAMIEVYSPLDLMAFQLITEYAPPLFKYLDVSRGFVVEVAIGPAGNFRE